MYRRITRAHAPIRPRMGRKSIVYTPGVWDLLHTGHLNLLQRAKLSGDYLIVGVCGDLLVEKTKGTPVMAETERAKLLMALQSVDEVHVYHSLDQRANLVQLNVDVFCVGEEFGNCEEHKLALQFCEEHGIEVSVIKRYPGVSSSALRQRAISRNHTPSFEKVSVAVDYHDCLTFDPAFFKALLSAWCGKVYILSGTPERRRLDVVSELESLGFVEGRDFEALLLGFDYDPKSMSIDHFKRMREHKLAKIRQYDIKVFFDDNPFYVEWMRNHGVTTFQIVLPAKYLSEFGAKDPFFSCHLQEKQFHFLSLLANQEVKK